MREDQVRGIQEGLYALAGVEVANELPPILRIPDLARVLGIGEEGARALIRRGELPAARVGKRYLLRREALYQWLKKLEARRAEGDPGAATAVAGLPRRRPHPDEAGL